MRAYSTSTASDRVMAKGRKESVISREIIDFLKLMGSGVYSTEQGFRDPKTAGRGGTRTSAGIPDLLVFGATHPRFFFIEVKREGGKLRDSQVGFQAECEKAGMLYLVAYDVRDVFDFLVAHGAIVTS